MAMIPEPAVPWPPPWPDAPRFGPPDPWPAYAYRPGLPHPRRHAEGHAYRLAEPPAQELKAESWRHNPLYLRSVDLYHAGFFWEAHEGWEALWRGSPGDTAEFLQGLIQNSAAQLKRNTGNCRGAQRMSRAAYQRLQRIEQRHVSYFGVNLQDFNNQILHHYQPLWQGEFNICGTAPRLLLVMHP